MEEKIQEKKVLSAEEIESQTSLELPDRQLLDVVTTIANLIGSVFNGGGGGGTTIIV